MDGSNSDFVLNDKNTINLIDSATLTTFETSIVDNENAVNEINKNYFANNKNKNNPNRNENEPNLSRNLVTNKTEHLSPNVNLCAYYSRHIRQQDDYLSEPLNKNPNMLSLDQIIEFYDAQNVPSFGALRNNSAKQPKLEQAISQEKKTVNFYVRKQTNKLKFGKKIYEFYNAPITKFWQNTIMYSLFLISFAYIVLVKTPRKLSYPEIFVLVYIFTYGLDKMRELLQTDTPRFSGKIKIFFSKVMNSLDLFFICSIIVALGFRLSKTEEHRKVARLLYCVNTIYWYVKFMEFFIINKYTGPLIIIASRMLVDLFNFAIILFVVLISFGLSRQAIKFPNEEKFQWSLVKKIFLEPYFMLYGEVYAPDIDPECVKEEPDAPQCQYGHWITPLTMTVFMIIACLLFLTILIASFNNTFVRISRQSAQFWKCQRYHFVTSYESKPMLAPPFVVISHVYMIIKYLVRLCQCKKIKFDRKLKAFLSDDMVQRLHDFEENSFYHYNFDLELSMNERMEERIHQTSTKVENISARIDDIFFKENMTKLSLYKVELRLQKLEELTVDAVTQLNSLCNLMRRQGSFLAAKSNKALLDEPSDEALTESNLNYVRQRRVTISGDGQPKSTTNNLNKSSSRTKISPNNSNNNNNNNNENNLTIRRKRMTSESQKKTVNENLEDDDETPRYTRKLTEKNSDNEEKVKFNIDDHFESKYLDKYRQKTRKSNLSSSSNESINSDRKVSNEEKEESEKNEAVKTRRKVNKVNSDVSNKSKPNNRQLKNVSDSSETEQILNEIYQSPVDQNQMLLASQCATGLDQCTLHPFVYLHSVVKPPLAEYTSITDCIDTSTIDRPPSPPLSASVNNHNSATLLKSSVNNNTTNTKGYIENINDYRAAESARSIVARQESEILRLAEESQHVIISQLLSKLVEDKSTKSVSSKTDSEHGLNSIDNTNSNNRRSSSSINNQVLAEDVKRMTRGCSETDDEELDVVEDQLTKDAFTLVNEEDELNVKNGSLFSGAKKKRDLLLLKKPQAVYMPAGLSAPASTIPMLNRNSSQLFYAQSQAKVLCLSNEEEIEKETDVV